MDEALNSAGVDLSRLDPALAESLRGKVSIVDGKADMSGLYFNGLGDDVANRVNSAITGITNWQNGIGTVQYGESSDYTYSVAEMANNYGGSGVIPTSTNDASALTSLNTLSQTFRQMPLPPKELSAVEAGAFNALVAQTGDGNWARLPTNDLRGVLHSLTATADGKLDLSGIYGGARGYDPGAPNDLYALQRELLVSYNEGSSEPMFLTYPASSGNGWSENVQPSVFTVPDPSVGSIVREQRGGGDSAYEAYIYKPSDATAAKYAADLAAYNSTFAKLTEAGIVQVRGTATGGLNVGNDYGYIGAANGAMAWSPDYGLVTSQQNIKYPEDDGGFFDFIGDIVETVVPVVLGAVFTYVGGPIGSFVFNYAMSDGDLEAALKGAAVTYVTSGMGAGFDGAASAGSTTGLAAALDIANPVLGAAVNNGAASAISSAASGGDFDDVLLAGAIGMASGAAGNYVSTSLPSSIGSEAVQRAIGNSVTSLTSSVLSGEDLDNALLVAAASTAGAFAGDALAGSGLAGSDPAVQRAIVTGTSALGAGLANSTITGAPVGNAIGQALGSGFSSYVQSQPLVTGAAENPDQPAQTFPVREPGTIETRPLDEAPVTSPSSVADESTVDYDEWGNVLPRTPAPQSPAEATPEPGASSDSTGSGSVAQTFPVPAPGIIESRPLSEPADGAVSPAPEQNQDVASDWGLFNQDNAGQISAQRVVDTPEATSRADTARQSSPPQTASTATAPAEPPVEPSDLWGRWDYVASGQAPVTNAPSTNQGPDMPPATAATSGTPAPEPADAGSSTPILSRQELQDQIDARRWLYATRAVSNLGVEPFLEGVSGGLNGGTPGNNVASRLQSGAAAASRFTGVGLMGGLGVASSITTGFDQLADGTAGGGWRAAASFAEAANFYRMYVGGLFAPVEYLKPLAERTSDLGRLTNTLLGAAGDRFGTGINVGATILRDFGLTADYNAAITQSTSPEDWNRLSFQYQQDRVANIVNGWFETAPYLASGTLSQAPMWGTWIGQKLTDSANTASSGTGGAPGTTGFRPQQVGTSWASTNNTINSMLGTGPTVPPFASPQSAAGYSSEVQGFLDAANYSARLSQNVFDTSVAVGAGFGALALSKDPRLAMYAAVAAPSAVNNTLNTAGNAFFQTPAERAAALQSAGLDPAGDPRAAVYGQPSFVSAVGADVTSDLMIAYREGYNYTHGVNSADRALMQRYAQYTQPTIATAPSQNGSLAQTIYNGANNINQAVSQYVVPPTILAARAAGNVVGLYDRAAEAVQQAATQAQNYVTSTAGTVRQSIDEGAASLWRYLNRAIGTTPKPATPGKP